MSIPENHETRQQYVDRMVEFHLDMAKLHHSYGNELSMWAQLFTWVQAEEIYGGHWDELEKQKEKK